MKFADLYLRFWARYNTEILRFCHCILTLLSHNSDENEISLYIITACPNIQVMMITKDEMS